MHRLSVMMSMLMLMAWLGGVPAVCQTLTPEQERALKSNDSFKECDFCPEMVVVPPGSLTVDDKGSEQPATFAKPFAVGRFTITYIEWDACARDGGCNGFRPDDWGWGRGRRAVVFVSWSDAKAYVTWLSRKTGKTYRLLTSVEREYAARAGTSTSLWRELSNSAVRSDDTVDAFKPNPWGLYQMHGYVWEWVDDCSRINDPSASSPDNCSRRLIRGGSWYSSLRHLRGAYDYGLSMDYRDDNITIRVARVLDGPQVVSSLSLGDSHD